MILDDIIDRSSNLLLGGGGFDDPFTDPFDVNDTALHGLGSLSQTGGANPYTLDVFQDAGIGQPWWWDTRSLFSGGQPLVQQDSNFDATTWMDQYQNGRIPIDALTEVHDATGRVGYLRPDAASSLNVMMQAAAKDGIQLKYTDTYRPYDVQVECVKNKGLYSQGGLCAEPGTSPHGWGKAIDFDVNDAATRRWLEVNGDRFGWLSQLEDEGGREPWHFDFDPTAAEPGALDNGLFMQTDTSQRVLIRRPRAAISQDRLLALIPGAQSSSGIAPEFQMALPMAVAEMFAPEPPSLRLRKPQGPGPGGRLPHPKGLDNVEANRNLAEQMAAARGWTGADWMAIRYIVEGHGSIPAESNWLGSAVNPTLPPDETAYGIGQRLIRAHPWLSDAEQQKYLTNVAYQIAWMFNYIEQRYGSPTAAWAYKVAHDNY